MEADEETRPSTSNADDIVGSSLGESEGHEISVDEIAKGERESDIAHLMRLAALQNRRPVRDTEGPRRAH